ncbi:MAG: TIGR02266 family protein [Polyangia bacterium]
MPDTPMVRVQLRYMDEATFVQRFAPNVTRGGIFLASRSPHPVGTVVAFEVAILQGPPLLAGTGKVTWVRERNPVEPHRAHGMGVQFLALDPGSRPMLERLLECKHLPPRFTPPVAVMDRSRGDAAPRFSGSAGSAGPAGSPAEDGQPDWAGNLAGWIDDQGVRDAVDRARALACKVDEDLEALLVRDRRSPSPDEALTELPRLLGLRRPGPAS